MRQNLETIEMDEIDFAQQEVVFGANSNYEEIIKIPESQIAQDAHLDIPSSLSPSGKYVFNESSNSLYIYREGSKEIEIALDKDKNYTWTDRRYKYSPNFALLTKKEVIGYAARQITNGLKTVQDKKKTKYADTPNWIINKVAKRIGKQISAFMDKRLQKVDPRFIAFHKAVMRFYGYKQYGNLCGGYGRVTYDLFAENAHFVNDCIKNPLATCLLNGSTTSYFTSIIEGYGSDKWLHYLSGGKPYSYLTKTINNLKPPIPSHLICNLSDVKLPREFTNKTEFVAFMFASGHHNFEPHRQTMSFVTEADLKKAFAIMVEKDMIVPRKGQHWNRFSFVSRTVGYALDYPEHTNCTFLNLFRRSVDWHGANPGRGGIGPRNTIARFPMEKELAKPPVALPEIPGITFLATYGDLFNEGNRMNHCVESYAEPCMTGQSFIFHIDHKGEMATAEIKKDGRISQVSGVCNKGNEACKYAKKKLLDWVYKSGWLKIEARNGKNTTLQINNNCFEAFYDEQPF